MTRSVLFESIQQSPIDPLFDNISDEGCEGYGSMLNVHEEKPNAPPRATPLIEAPVKVRLIDSREWAVQIGDGLDGPNGLKISRSSDGISISNDQDRIGVSSNGVRMEWNGEVFTFGQQLPSRVNALMAQGYATISAWRSRVVRLSMDSDDLECSLMDDLYPPRTFLVEYKNSPILKSIKVQDGIIHWESIAGRVITVPATVLEDDLQAGKFMQQIAPELTLVDVDQVWAECIQLRGLCLDEDRRLTMARRNEGKRKPALVALSGG